jgi:anti-sigma regulatory factor (Ser/Thr protein kinase)
LSETVYLKIGADADTSDADTLQYIQGSVEELGEREAWPESLTFKVNLVLEELGINILTHGGKGKERRPEIEIVLTSEDHALTIEVLDDGHPFDPLQDSPKPDLTATIEGRPIGGLGIHLVRSLMDDLHYQRDAGRNRLTLVARRD